MNSLTAKQGNILVVDDRPDSLRLAVGILQQSGHRVRPVLGGKAAQTAIQTELPELVLADLNMPNMSGLDLCRWMKRDPAKSPIPLIFVSGEADSARKAEAFRAGAVDFLAKPFEPEELLLRIDLHLRLARQQRALEQHHQQRELEIHERLQHSNAELCKLYAAIEQSPASVIITNAKGTIEYVNRKFTEVTGYSTAEAIGNNPRILRSPDTPPETYNDLWSTISKGHVWSGVLHNRRKDGTFFFERASIAPVRLGEGHEVSHFIAVKEDITAQREIEAQLHQAQKMEAIGQLAAGIAHEINTPTQFVSDNLHFLNDAFRDMLGILAAYRRALDLLTGTASQASLRAEIREREAAADIDYVLNNSPGALASSLDGLSRIANIVRAMKEFSHPDKREMAPANLNTAIENTLIIARNEYKYVAEVETSLGDIPPVTCHVGDLCQVFLNLLVNAAHAIGDVMRTSGKRGMIRIRTSVESGFVRIDIADSGTGIPEKIQPRIFEAFFTTKEVGRGTGQGLALAHAIVVKRHKGKLAFETEVGKGTTFIIRIPLDPGELRSTGELTAVPDDQPAQRHGRDGD